MCALARLDQVQQYVIGLNKRPALISKVGLYEWSQFISNLFASENKSGSIYIYIIYVFFLYWVKWLGIGSFMERA